VDYDYRQSRCTGLLSTLVCSIAERFMELKNRATLAKRSLTSIDKEVPGIKGQEIRVAKKIL